MSKMFFAVLILSLSVSTAAAQGKEEKPAQAGTVRVAVVNIGLVFNQYDRAKVFKKELEDALIPYKAKGKALADQLKKWNEQLQAGDINPAQKEKLEMAIRDGNRQLEDMKVDLTKAIGKKQEDHLVTLWKEVQDGIKTYATQHGIQLVLGYGDPMEKELLDFFPNVNRKMQAMDQGSTVPLFFTDGVDIAEGVAELLNKRLRDTKKPGSARGPRFQDF